MFLTHPSAATPQIPEGLFGDKTLWNWVEFGVETPLFLATLMFHTDKLELEFDYKQLLLSHVQQVSDATKLLPGDGYLRAVSLLSPGKLNGSAEYKLTPLAEIWVADDMYHQRFVCMDRTELLYSTQAGTPKGDWRRIYRCPVMFS